MERDVSIEYHGSITLVTLNTQKARDWVAEYVEIQPYMQRGKNIFALESNCADALFVAMNVHGELTTDA